MKNKIQIAALLAYALFANQQIFSKNCSNPATKTIVTENLVTPRRNYVMGMGKVISYKPNTVAAAICPRICSRYDMSYTHWTSHLLRGEAVIECHCKGCK